MSLVRWIGAISTHGIFIFNCVREFRFAPFRRKNKAYHTVVAFCLDTFNKILQFLCNNGDYSFY